MWFSLTVHRWILILLNRHHSVDGTEHGSMTASITRKCKRIVTLRIHAGDVISRRSCDCCDGIIAVAEKSKSLENRMTLQIAPKRDQCTNAQLYSRENSAE